MLNQTMFRLGAAAALLLMARGLSGCSCTSAGCDDQLDGVGQIAVGVNERAFIEIEACRNDVCSQGVLDSDTFQFPSETIKLSGDASVSCTLSPSAGFWELEVRFKSEDGAGEFDDDDEISLRVMDLAASEIIVDLQQTIDYRTASPNGEWCGPKCQQQEFDIPNTAGGSA